MISQRCSEGRSRDPRYYPRKVFRVAWASHGTIEASPRRTEGHFGLPKTFLGFRKGCLWLLKREVRTLKRNSYSIIFEYLRYTCCQNGDRVFTTGSCVFAGSGSTSSPFVSRESCKRWLGRSKKYPRASKGFPTVP